MIQVPGKKKGAEMTAAKRVNETPDFFSTVLCRSSVNEANEFHFCCLTTFLIRFCTTGDSHNFPSHSSGLALPTTPAFQSGTLGAPSSVEPCVSQPPASQAGEWSLVAREETAASESSPAAAGLSKQLLLHLHHSPAQVSSWLSHSWASCSTPH